MASPAGLLQGLEVELDPGMGPGMKASTSW